MLSHELLALSAQILLLASLFEFGRQVLVDLGPGQPAWSYALAPIGAFVALPMLTHQQRRELCQRIIALEAEQSDLAMCDRTAGEGFSMLDQMEGEDAAHARRKQG